MNSVQNINSNIAGVNNGNVINPSSVMSFGLYSDYVDIRGYVTKTISNFNYQRDISIDSLIVELVYDIIFNQGEFFYKEDDDSYGGPGFLRTLLHLVKNRLLVRVWKDKFKTIDQVNFVIQDDLELMQARWPGSEVDANCLNDLVITVGNHGVAIRIGSVRYSEDTNNFNKAINSKMLSALFSYNVFFEGKSVKLETLEGETLTLGNPNRWEEEWDDEEERNVGFFAYEWSYTEHIYSVLDWALEVPESELNEELREKQHLIKQVFDSIEV